MSPRRSVIDTGQTHAAIVARGVEVASVAGLDGLTIGRLAADLGMSKSGLLGHFGSKEALQLEVVDAAAAIFTREVPDRATHRAVDRAADGPGLARLRAICAAWVSYLERPVFPGGCFFMAAVSEYDDRPGRVRDAIAGLAALWERDLRLRVRAAVRAGELPADTDPEQVVFELAGIMTALNYALRLRRDPAAVARAERAIARLLTPMIRASFT
ncbi:TetR/AcrR family transcriptional regulator [Actinomycetes bacterium KLBMP 9797]